MKKKIAIIGTNGIPAQYGGFETLVEYLAEYLSNDFEITVFCSSATQKKKLHKYKGVNLKYLNFNANGWQSIFYDFFSIFYSILKNDKILILGCSGGILQPLYFFYKHKLILNLGGIDWKRSKWNYLSRVFLRISECFAVKFSSLIISDNQGIKDYLLKQYGKDSLVIAYGGDQASNVISSNIALNKYPFLDSLYAFTVARIQSDNNIEMICNAFILNTPLPLVIVGNWNNSKYGQLLKEHYKQFKNIIMLDAIYDPIDLNLLRSNCYLYLHGHSAGGTNPALVEAMNLKLPIFAYDNEFNRYTTNNKAQYFFSTDSLNKLINNLELIDLKSIANDLYVIAKNQYTWKAVCMEYAKIFNK